MSFADIKLLNLPLTLIVNFGFSLRCANYRIFNQANAMMSDILCSRFMINF